MAASEWLACDHPDPLIAHLCRRGGRRRVRLFVLACVRKWGDYVGGLGLAEVVETAFAYADGRATGAELGGARRRIAAAKEGNRVGPGAPGFALHWSITSALEVATATDPTHASVLHACRACRSAADPEPDDGSGSLAWAELRRQVALLRCLCANPFRPIAFDPAWRTDTAVALARGVYGEWAFDRLPILADALQDAGCDNSDALDHCRQPGEHGRGCWVVDGVLGCT